MKNVLFFQKNDGVNAGIKDSIKRLRPDYNIDNVIFLTYQQNSGWRNHTIGREIHVFIDNSVHDDMVISQVKGINDVYGKRKN